MQLCTQNTEELTKGVFVFVYTRVLTVVPLYSLYLWTDSQVSKQYSSK
jgi:hypothetical protein